MDSGKVARIYAFAVDQTAAAALTNLALTVITLTTSLLIVMGFSVLGPWIDREASRYVWLLGFDGDGRAADDAYRAARERQPLDPDPARLIAESRVVWLEPV